MAIPQGRASPAPGGARAVVRVPASHLLLSIRKIQCRCRVTANQPSKPFIFQGWIDRNRPFAATQPSRRERLFLPQTCRSEYPVEIKSRGWEIGNLRTAIQLIVPRAGMETVGGNKVYRSPGVWFSTTEPRRDRSWAN